MKLEPFWTSLEVHINVVIDSPFAIRQRQSLSGGCINRAWKISDHRRDYFVKTHAASGLAMFAAEAEGFPARFYAAYREVGSLDAGFRQRRMVYNLYHILNHLNLFSGGYCAQAE